MWTGQLEASPWGLLNEKSVWLYHCTQIFTRCPYVFSEVVRVIHVLSKTPANKRVEPILLPIYLVSSVSPVFSIRTHGDLTCRPTNFGSSEIGVANISLLLLCAATPHTEEARPILMFNSQLGHFPSRSPKANGGLHKRRMWGTVINGPFSLWRVTTAKRSVSPIAAREQRLLKFHVFLFISLASFSSRTSCVRG